MAHALQTQRWVIDHSGGLPGVKNVEHLESVLGHIRNGAYYPEMTDKLCHLVFSINKNHSFNDGNKRSSIALGAYFLELNGYDYVVARFVHEMENIAVYVADNVVSKELLRDVIASLLYEDDFSESLKLALITAISNAQTGTDFE
ncbi:MAG: type II toxin-antitoxin system death-on-curing family toxin [Betaproteobacteria bacterium]|nr:type II toxin-antitoxin system death-on-curing family toxin [Betaproteobacteria bacterium]